MQALHDAGVTHVLRIEDGRVLAEDDAFGGPPDAFDVLAVYRFEGDSNPDDESAIYVLLHRPSGRRGQLLAPYGPMTPAAEWDVLAALRGRDAPPPAG